jgi:hypothetical protein
MTMAKPAPCQACLEVPDADFYVTNRLGVPWPFEQATVSLCVTCFIQTGIRLGEALQAALAELEAMAEPGALEQIESDEGKAPVTKSGSKRRPRKPAAAAVQVVEPEAAEESPAPDADL